MAVASIWFGWSAAGPPGPVHAFRPVHQSIWLALVGSGRLWLDRQCAPALVWPASWPVCGWAGPARAWHLYCTCVSARRAPKPGLPVVCPCGLVAWPAN